MNAVVITEGDATPGEGAMNPEWAYWAWCYWASRPNEALAQWSQNDWIAYFNVHWPHLVVEQQQ